jgi:hypothetical protein
VQGLSLRELARGELAEKLDVVGGREGLEHCSHLVRATCTGQLAVVVGKRVVKRSKPSTRCGSVERAVLLEEAPEDERVSAALVWAGREQVARLDDRRARTSRVLRDTQLLFDVVRIDSGAPLVTRATTGAGHRCTSTCHASRKTIGFSHRTP